MELSLVAVLDLLQIDVHIIWFPRKGYELSRGEKRKKIYFLIFFLLRFLVNIGWRVVGL